MLKYYKLFTLLESRNLKKKDLLEILSPGTIAKLSKGENLSTDTIDKLCIHLKCQPGDIMEAFEAFEYTSADGKHNKYLNRIQSEEERLEEIRRNIEDEIKSQNYDKVRKELDGDIKQITHGFDIEELR